VLQSFHMTTHSDPTPTPTLLFGNKISSWFETAKDQKNLRGWLTRAYFSPKNKGEVYYNPNVTPENVLEYITSIPKKFPQSPHAIVGLWKILPGLREDLGIVFGKEERDERQAKHLKESAELASDKILNAARAEIAELALAEVDAPDQNIESEDVEEE